MGGSARTRGVIDVELEGVAALNPLLLAIRRITGLQERQHCDGPRLTDAFGCFVHRHEQTFVVESQQCPREIDRAPVRIIARFCDRSSASRAPGPVAESPPIVPIAGDGLAADGERAGPFPELDGAHPFGDESRAGFATHAAVLDVLGDSGERQISRYPIMVVEQHPQRPHRFDHFEAKGAGDRVTIA